MEFLGTDEERLFSNQMMTIWSNFAKYGNPNSDIDSLPTWGEFIPDSESMFLKGFDDFENAPEWRANAVRLWVEHLIPTYPA